MKISPVSPAEKSFVLVDESGAAVRAQQNRAFAEPLILPHGIPAIFWQLAWMPFTPPSPIAMIFV